MIGDIYKNVQGFTVEVISEPFHLGHADSEYVSVRDLDGYEYDIELDELLYSAYFKYIGDKKNE